jgi:hypothetical protein
MGRSVAPVAFSKIAAISLMYPSSGANQGPEMVTFCPLKSGPLYDSALTLVLKNKTLTKNAKANFIVVFIFPPKKTINLYHFYQLGNPIITERDSIYAEKIYKYREY